MSVTALTIIKSVEAGVALAAASGDTGNGNSFDNTNGDVVVYLENTHVSSTITFTFVAQNTSFDQGPEKGTLTAANLVIVVAAASKQLIGPLPRKVFNDASNLVQITYTGSGTPKIQPFKVDHTQRG